MDRHADLQIVGRGDAMLILPVSFEPGGPLVADLGPKELVTATSVPRIPENTALLRYMQKYGYFRAGQVLEAGQLNALIDAVLELASKG